MEMSGEFHAYFSPGKIAPGTHWRLEGPQSRSAHFAEENILTLPVIEPRFPGCVEHV
jgi:hypothetical protein